MLTSLFLTELNFELVELVLYECKDSVSMYIKNVLYSHTHTHTRARARAHTHTHESYTQRPPSLVPWFSTVSSSWSIGFSPFIVCQCLFRGVWLVWYTPVTFISSLVSHIKDTSLVIDIHVSIIILLLLLNFRFRVGHSCLESNKNTHTSMIIFGD